MKPIAAVYDGDGTYGERLAGYLEKKEKIPFQIVFFTREEVLVSFAKEHVIGVLIVSQKKMTDAIRELNAAYWIVLTEERCAAQQEGMRYHQMYKYQSAEEIVRLIMRDSRMLSLLEQKQEPSWRHPVSVIAVYSLAEDCLKTMFALAVANQLSQRESVLYLNLGAVSGLEYVLERESEGDLSEAVYHMHHGNLREKLPSIVQTYGAMDYIAPVRCPEDLRVITAEDFVHLLREISESQMYTAIVVDLAEGLYSPADILSVCQTIYMPVKQDFLSEFRRKDFWNYLDACGKADLQERIQQIRLPSCPGAIHGGRYMEQLLWGEIGDCARAVLGGGAQEREAVL